MQNEETTPDDTRHDEILALQLYLSQGISIGDDEDAGDAQSLLQSHATDSDLNDAYLDKLLNDDDIGAAIDSVLVEEPLQDEEANRDFSDPSLESTFRTVLVENLPPSKPIKRLKTLLEDHKCPSPEKIVSIFGDGNKPRRVIIRFVDPEAAADVVKCNGAICMGREVSFRLYNPVEDALSNLRSFEPVSPRSQELLDCYLVTLTEILERHYKASKPTEAVHTKRELLFSELDKVLNESEVFSKLVKHVDYLPDDGSPALKLELFGSVPSLFSSRTSDLDISIVGESLDSLAVLKEWIRVLRRRRLGRLQFIGRARVPVIKLNHYATNLEVDFTVKDDVVNQRLKTWFLQACARKDDRAVKLVLLIKFWSKQRNIGDASTGTLNSFGFTLLVIHFLQCGCGDRPVLPKVILDGPIDLPTDRSNPFQTESFMQWRSQNINTIGELLYGFFEYYATSWDVTSEIISVRDCRRIPMPLPLRPGKFHKTQQWMMVIQDPFDRHDNVARNVSKDAAKRIITEMRRAYDMMRHCSPWTKICEKVLEARPKPRPFQGPAKSIEHASNGKWKKKPAPTQSARKVPSAQIQPTSNENKSRQHIDTGRPDDTRKARRSQKSQKNPTRHSIGNAVHDEDHDVANNGMPQQTSSDNTFSKRLNGDAAQNGVFEPASHSEEVKQDEEKENIGNMPVSDRSRRAKRRERLRNAQSAAQQIVTVVLDADAVTHPTPPKKQKKKRKPTHPAANASADPVVEPDLQES